MQRIEAIKLGSAQQSLDGGSASACALRSGEEPVFLANGNWAYCILDGVVVCALVRHD
jgi:hypothetical protein